MPAKVQKLEAELTEARNLRDDMFEAAEACAAYALEKSLDRMAEFRRLAARCRQLTAAIDRAFAEIVG